MAVVFSGRKLSGRAWKAVWLCVLFLSVSFLLMIRNVSVQSSDLALENEADLQLCTERYEPGAVLFSSKQAEKILADPSLLRSYIKSVSGRRYWGLSDHLKLVRGMGGESPYVLQVTLPKGSINPGNKYAPRGGAGYMWIPGLPKGTSRACLTYSVWFPKNYDFVKGGKLPGLFGGMGPSGGKKVTGKNGFSTRFMWRRDGDGEVYGYIIGNDQRGISIDRGAWRFVPGKWTRLAQEVILNTPGKTDGRVRVWVDGRLVIDKGGLSYRTTPDLQIRGVMAHVFFGGKKPSWASSRDTFVRMTPFDLRWKKGEQPLLAKDMALQGQGRNGTGD